MPQPPAPDAFLTKILRHGVPAEDGARLAATYRDTVAVQARADIFVGETRCDSLAVLLDGWACKYQILTNGRRQIATLHLPGDVLNLGSLKRPGLAFSVAALDDCTVAILPLARLRTLIGERPAIRDLFLSLCVAETVAMTERVVSLGGHSSRQRVAHFLLDILGRLEELGPVPSAALRLPLTQQDIGDALGLSTIHVSRTFQALRQGGLVTTKGRTYTIRDRDGLRALADDDAGPRRGPHAPAAERAGAPRPPVP